jgi:hypothetical protein
MTSHREDQIKAILEDIRAENGGRLTRQAVLAYASANKKSVLGKMFDWNKERAATAHWLDRAQEIISRYVTVIVVDETMKIRVPYYVSDPTAKSNEGGYVATMGRHSRGDATVIVTNELDRIVSAIERARGIAHALDQQHRGLSARLQGMLEEAVTLKDWLGGIAA